MMDVKVLFQQEHCEVEQIGNHAIKIKFKGFLKITHLTAVDTFMDAFVKNNRIDMLMVDQSGLKVLSKEVQDHLSKTILVIASIGLKRIALVDAEDVFAKATLDKISKEAPRDGVMRANFYSEKTALEWLLS
jgi:hypothetical protein